MTKKNRGVKVCAHGESDTNFAWIDRSAAEARAVEVYIENILQLVWTVANTNRVVPVRAMLRRAHPAAGGSFEHELWVVLPEELREILAFGTNDEEVSWLRVSQHVIDMYNIYMHAETQQLQCEMAPNPVLASDIRVPKVPRRAANVARYLQVRVLTDPLLTYDARSPEC